MKVLLAHNHYYWPGGEDEVFRRESQLLRSAGNEVVEYIRYNRTKLGSREDQNRIANRLGFRQRKAIEASHPPGTAGHRALSQHISLDLP